MARTAIRKVVANTNAPHATCAVAMSAGFRQRTVRIPKVSWVVSNTVSNTAGRSNFPSSR